VRIRYKRRNTRRSRWIQRTDRAVVNVPKYGKMAAWSTRGRKPNALIFKRAELNCDPR